LADARGGLDVLVDCTGTAIPLLELDFDTWATGPRD
jgi:hypothetical protein